MPELKVTSAHLQRDAYLYIRQSTPAKWWKTSRARSVSTRCEIAPWPKDGPWNESM